MNETNKSVLLIDTPKCCSECDIMFTDEYSNWCPYKSAKTDVYDYIHIHKNTKPDWCPLSPVPSYKDVTQYIQRGDGKSMIHMVMSAHDQGFNDCLDEILKGNNEKTN